ncbi:hypothetical protein FB473_001801 [Brooklawnia cerclae]|uniref:Uncharacterized protein n=1 Tax=Brooklawnia cerclae TaxID=349934 RepID=A0ABX0SKA9_9ACTN|nr:hypothetical protein [Brooklawnia cerclae]
MRNRREHMWCGRPGVSEFSSNRRWTRRLARRPPFEVAGGVDEPGDHGEPDEHQRQRAAGMASVG